MTADDLPFSCCTDRPASQIQITVEFLDPKTHQETSVLVPVVQIRAYYKHWILNRTNRLRIKKKRKR